ncbi:hypothetical protein BGZ67_004580 [Mortierella alpina]|nr:hypothetical protein BGZ67_004580 [Mortierella alpina]
MSTAKKNPPAARASALNPPAKTMKTSSPALAPNAIAPGLAAPAQAPNNAKSNRPVLSSSLAQQKTQPAKPAVSKIHDPAVNSNNNPVATLTTQQGDAVKEKKENVSATTTTTTTTTSEYVPHRFQWRQGGTNVMVTGTFDDWQQSIKLKPTLGDHLEAIVNLDRSKKILFKFVVDGHWHCSDEFATESDPSGNQNNILPPIKV